MKKWKRRWLAGTLAVVMTCTALLTGGSAAFAASDGTGQVKKEAEGAGKSTEEHMEENKEEAKEGTVLEDLTLQQGEAFDIEKDFRGITLKDKETAVFQESLGEDGKKVEFDINRPGTCQCAYLIKPEKGEAYRLTRTVTVTPREARTTGADAGKKDTGSDEEGEADPKADPKPAPQAEEVPEEAKISEEGVFLAVVPAAMHNSRAGASLVKGENIYYPSDL